MLVDVIKEANRAQVEDVRSFRTQIEDVIERSTKVCTRSVKVAVWIFLRSPHGYGYSFSDNPSKKHPTVQDVLEPPVASNWAAFNTHHFGHQFLEPIPASWPSFFDEVTAEIPKSLGLDERIREEDSECNNQSVNA